MKKIIEAALIWILKCLRTDLLAHAHVQLGVGHNTYLSGEEAVIETHITRILRREPMVIFDVGANRGDYAIALRKQFPAASIYCFEPILDNFEVLRKKTEGLNIECENLAISNNLMPLPLYRSTMDVEGAMCSPYKNVLETVFDFNGTNLTVERCPSITLDKYCEGKIAEVDFLKIDIEGHELAALEGATELLKDGRIKLIQFEFNEFNLQSKSTFLRFYETLKNFTFYRIMPNGSLTPMGPYDSSLEIYRYQNILCVLQ